MRVLILNTTDYQGGAARATYKLHRALVRSGEHSTLGVASKSLVDPDVVQLNQNKDLTSRVIRKTIETAMMALRRYYRPQDVFSHHRAYLDRAFFATLGRFDLIQLNWVAHFLDYPSFFRWIQQNRIPVVWRLADMNPFTGGCHYDGGCGRYTSGCGACPLLYGDLQQDLSSSIWSQKAEIFGGLDRNLLTVVCLSRWMASHVGVSPFFSRFESVRIPNGVDIDCFHPRERAQVRAALDFPQDKRLLLLLANELSERRKGIHLAVEAVNSLSDRERYFVVAVGNGASRLPIGAPMCSFERIDENRLLAMMYAAADAFVMPSLEDNFPNTVLESLACGTPVVGFDVGGMPDIVEDGTHGSLLRETSADCLREGIERLFQNRQRRLEMGERARAHICDQFSLETQADRYRALYRRAVERLR